MNETFKKSLPVAIYSILYFFLIDSWWRYGLFVLGVILATALLILDEEKFYQFYQESETKEGHSGETNNLQKSSSNYLATRSTLFLLSMIPLSFFVVSSTGSAMGSGFVLGLMLNLLLEMWVWQTSAEQFSHRFLSQLKKQLSSTQIQFLVWGSTAYFVILNLWAAIIR